MTTKDSADKAKRSKKMPGIGSSRTVRSVRKKIQKEIDRDVLEIESRLADLRRILGMNDGGEAPRSAPAPTEGLKYFIREGDSCGVFFLERTVAGANVLHLFRNIVTGSTVTYTLHSISNDLDEFREVDDDEVLDFRRNYFQNILISDGGRRKKKGG